MLLPVWVLPKKASVKNVTESDILVKQKRPDFKRASSFSLSFLHFIFIFQIRVANLFFLYVYLSSDLKLIVWYIDWLRQLLL
jgi:hypothetical protein